jgi:hypothetical protein
MLSTRSPWLIQTSTDSRRAKRWKIPSGLSTTTLASPNSRFWERSTDTHQTLAATGIEHLINSPDAHTGAYYEYDLDRTLLLSRWRDRPLFISLSAQRGRSEVGKQGIILGDDSRWTYLYSGIPGLNWPGFGWVDSYLYDSYSVVFYLGTQTGGAPTRCGIFKWIKAGWAGTNVARKAHIHDGLQRYADAFKLILESPRTRDMPGVVRLFSGIRDMPASQLTRMTASYLAALGAELRSSSSTNGAERAAEWLDKDSYLESIGSEERIAIVSLERLKALLGKRHHLTFDSASGFRPHRP